MGDIKVVSKKAMSAKICTAKQWKTERKATYPVQSHSQDYATNCCIMGEWERNTKEGKRREKKIYGTLNAQYTRDYFTEVTEWYENGHFSPPITQSYYRHLLCRSVTGGFASDPCSWRQLDHRDVNCWPWQEQPFSCSAKMRKNCCWHGLLGDCICFQAMGSISVKKSINKSSWHNLE